MNKLVGILERRKKREEINDSDTINIIEKLNVKEGMNCLEIGAGLGSIAFYIAQQVGERGHVDVIDLKKENIDYIKQFKRANISAKLADITNYSRRKQYDFIHARFVFEHIKDREKIIKDIVEYNLKPHGCILIEDAVYEHINFSGSHQYQMIMNSYKDIIKRNVHSNFEWGYSMCDCLENNGLINCQSIGNIRTFRGGSDESDFWIQSFTEVYEEIIKLGINKDIIEQVLNELRDKNNWFSGPNIVIAYGEKNEKKQFER